MTAEQEAFVDMLEEKGFSPNLLMLPDGKNWERVECEVRHHGDQITLTFDPDGKLIEVTVE